MKEPPTPEVPLPVHEDGEKIKRNQRIFLARKLGSSNAQKRPSKKEYQMKMSNTLWTETAASGRRLPHEAFRRTQARRGGIECSGARRYSQPAERTRTERKRKLRNPQFLLDFRRATRKTNGRERGVPFRQDRGGGTERRKKVKWHFLAHVEPSRKILQKERKRNAWVGACK